jgi:hypothetical protein
VPQVPAGFQGTVTSGEFEPLPPGRSRRFVLELRPTKLGALEVPPFSATAAAPASDRPVVATTPALSLQVASVLADQGAAVEAPAPPFAPRFDLVPWAAAAGAGGALVLALLWWRRRPRHARPAQAETPLPPHVTALRALARLRSASRSSPAEVDAFYVEVSRILRVYLEEGLGLRAPERTTDEFLAELGAQGARSGLDPAQRDVLAGFLRQCDLVKFARALPGEDVHLESLRIAEELVQATRADRARTPERAVQEAAS